MDDRHNRRIALGADYSQVLNVVMKEGCKLCLLGVGLGVAAAIGLTHLISTLLYGVTPTDPPTFAAVGLLLTLVALAACWIPARRATRVDPMVALSYE